MFSIGQKNQIQQFAFYMLWGDKNHRVLDMTNTKDVLLAVNKAYIDMQPRTIDGLGLSLKDGKEPSKRNNAAYWNIVKVKEKNIKDLKTYLANQVVGIINCINATSTLDKQSIFDKEHSYLCNSFIKKFQTAINNINSAIEDAIRRGVSPNGIPANYLKHNSIDPEQITYGKAQKIVNMTFKYLSMFDNANQYSNVFQYCHVAIDGYIIDEVKDMIKLYKIKPAVQENNTLKKVWSNYTNEDYYNMLSLMCCIINEACYKGGKTLFFEEFEWWAKHI